VILYIGKETEDVKYIYIQLYSPIYMVAEIRKTTEKKKERNLAIAPMTSIP